MNNTQERLPQRVCRKRQTPYSLHRSTVNYNGHQHFQLLCVKKKKCNYCSVNIIIYISYKMFTYVSKNVEIYHCPDITRINYIFIKKKEKYYFPRFINLQSSNTGKRSRRLITSRVRGLTQQDDVVDEYGAQHTITTRFFTFYNSKIIYYYFNNMQIQYKYIYI